MVHHQMAEHQKLATHRRGDHRAFIHADDIIVLDDALVRVKLIALFEIQGEVSTFRIGELHAITVFKRTRICH